MDDELKVSFERTVKGEEAIVLTNGLHNLDNPKLLDILQKTGVPSELFRQLVSVQYDWKIAPTHKEVFSHGEKLEDLEIGIVDTELGETEVSEISLYPDAIDPQNISLHLKQRDHRGFEAILVMEGAASLFFPDVVNPVGTGLYARSNKGTHVNLKKGDLVFIPAPTANGWERATEGFKFRYIGFPPWNSDFVAPTI
jgi:hypothetical protein